MNIIRGKVVKGVSERSHWMKKLESYYSSKTGIRLFPVRLQIQLLEDYSIRESSQFQNKLVWDTLQDQHSNTCYINGIKVSYLESRQKEISIGDQSQSVIEIVTDLELIESLALGYGDEVEVAMPAVKEALLH
jgi:CTP-dependent riboflavin kinase